jgi:ribonuclease HI
MTDDGIIYAYSDMSMKDNTISLGYVLLRHTRDGGKQLLEASNRLLVRDRQPYDYTINQAEYRACISAVRAATEYPDDTLVLYTDNEGVADAIDEGSTIHSSGYFQHCIYSFLEWFESWVVAWKGRESNYAHSQARRGMELRTELVSDGVEV